MLICREICFVAIYAALAQNLFCRNLRAFVWRKIYSKIVLVEKKGQISGMPYTVTFSISLAKSHCDFYERCMQNAYDVREYDSQMREKCWCKHRLRCNLLGKARVGKYT